MGNTEAKPHREPANALMVGPPADASGHRAQNVLGEARAKTVWPDAMGGRSSYGGRDRPDRDDTGRARLPSPCVPPQPLAAWRSAARDPVGPVPRPLPLITLRLLASAVGQSKPLFRSTLSSNSMASTRAKRWQSAANPRNLASVDISNPHNERTKLARLRSCPQLVEPDIDQSVASFIAGQKSGLFGIGLRLRS